MNKFLIIFVLFFIPLSFISAKTITIESLTPNYIIPLGGTVNFDLKSSGFTTSRPKYILADSLPGSTISNSHIDHLGRFKWTPSISDIGTHTIVIQGIDSDNSRANITQTLIVEPESPLRIQSLSPGQNVLPHKIVSFIVVATGFRNPLFSVRDSFSGSSITNFNISSSGIFTWTPQLSDIGTHNLTIRVYGDGGREASIYQTITVKGINIKNASHASSINIGQSLSFDIYNYGLNRLTYTVTDSLRDNTISQSTISNDRFVWTPQIQDIGQHTITIEATDNNTDFYKINFNINVTGTTVNNPVPNIPNKFIFTQYLYQGIENNEVIELQKRLISLGYLKANPIGYFGNQTKQALIQYQKARGLDPIGVVGPATRAILNR